MKRRIGRTLLVVAMSVLLLSTTGSAQQRGASFPVIVVFDDGVSFEAFRGSYRPDDRAQANPAAWNYLDRGVAGFVLWLNGGSRQLFLSVNRRARWWLRKVWHPSSKGLSSLR